MRTILILMLAAEFCRAASPPRFQDYPVFSVYRGKVKAPHFGDLNKYSGTDLRCYGQEPSFYSNKPVSFSGHFVISGCPCGSGCLYQFMWDALSGKVYLDFPVRAIDVGPYRDDSNVPSVVYKARNIAPTVHC